MMRVNIKHFIVSSVLVHAMALSVWTGTQTHTLQIPFSAASAPVFNVALNADAGVAAPAQAAAKAHRQRKPTDKTHARQPPPLIKPTQSQHIAQTPHHQPAANNPHLAETHRNEIRDRVLSRVRSNLSQYFVYPPLAQRQGWQGQVLLGFSVEADGKIQNIHVATGSGYPILDTSAVAALSRVPHLYEASEWLHGKRLELELPVIFRLQGG